jgi:hypothetical protein
MRKTAITASLIAFIALPAFADSSQLARSVGVEPGTYSLTQLIQLHNLQNEPGGWLGIKKILDNPRGDALVGRLSTTDHRSDRD